MATTTEIWAADVDLGKIIEQTADIYQDEEQCVAQLEANMFCILENECIRRYDSLRLYLPLHSASIRRAPPDRHGSSGRSFVNTPLLSASYTTSPRFRYRESICGTPCVPSVSPRTFAHLSG